MPRKLPIIAILAIISWYGIKFRSYCTKTLNFCKALPIPTSLTTPGTLFVSPRNVTSVLPINVRSYHFLGISTTNISQSSYFHVSRPLTGPNSPNNSSLLFQGPRTILSRLSAAVAAVGAVLPIAAPSVNSAYTIQFLSPMVECSEAKETEKVPRKYRERIDSKRNCIWNATKQGDSTDIQRLFCLRARPQHGRHVW